MSPPAMAHAMRNVPVSMRSGMISCLDGFEFGDTVDFDEGGPRAGHVCTHPVQELGEVGDLGFACRVLDARCGRLASAAAVSRFSVAPTRGKVERRSMLR